MLQQCKSFFVSLCCGHKRDIHSMDDPCRVYIDFRKYGLLLNTHIIGTPPIKALVRDSLKVSSPGKRQVNQSVKKFIHDFLAQCNLATDRHAFTKFKVRD